MERIICFQTNKKKHRDFIIIIPDIIKDSYSASCDVAFNMWKMKQHKLFAALINILIGLSSFDLVKGRRETKKGILDSPISVEKIYVNEGMNL